MKTTEIEDKIILFLFTRNDALKRKFEEKAFAISSIEGAKIIPFREIRVSNLRMLFKMADKQSLAGYMFDKVYIDEYLPIELEDFIKLHTK